MTALAFASCSATNSPPQAHRLLVSVVFTGAKVFGRAFTEAYRQAAQQTSKQSASAAANKAADIGISLDESAKILDLDLKSGGITLDKIDEKYNYLFDINAKEKAGSFYLQSKVYWAAERLKSELKAKEALKAETEQQKGEPGESPEAKP